MKKAKKISLIVIVSVVAVIFLVMFLTATLYSCTRSVDTLPTDFDLERPDAAKIDFGNFDELDAQGRIAKAIEIYNKANELDQMTPYRMFYSKCESLSRNDYVTMNIDLFIHEFKNPSSYYKTAYRLIASDSNKPPPGADGIFEMQSAERIYHDSALTNFARYEKSLSPSIGKNGPTANWQNPKKKEIPIPYYNKNQPIKYTKSNHTITPETVINATLEQNEDGTITVAIVLDTENPITTVNSRPAIQEGSNADNAHFTEAMIKFTIWDNGYYKESEISEKWAAEIKVIVMNVKLENEFVYTEKYTYDKNICDIDKLTEAKELIYKKD